MNVRGNFSLFMKITCNAELFDHNRIAELPFGKQTI